MPDKINIPVVVTGAEQAKAELRGVVSGVQEVKQAAVNPYAQLGALRGEAPARRPGGIPGVEPERAVAAEQRALAATTEQTLRAGAAAETAAGKKQLFTRQARVLAATLLGEINPAMGGMVNLFSQIALGIGQMTAGLIALAGGAALLGGLIAFFKELQAAAQAAREAIDRAEEARREARGEGMTERERIREQAAAVGLVGATSAIQANARALERAENIPPEIAENLALAQILSRQRRRPFDPGAYLAGVLAGGGQPPKLEGMEAAATIQETLARGRSREARAAAETWKWELKQEPSRAPPQGGEAIAPADAALAELAREARGLTENETNAARKVLAAKIPLGVKWKAAMEALGLGIFRPGVLANLTGGVAAMWCLLGLAGGRRRYVHATVELHGSGRLVYGVYLELIALAAPTSDLFRFGPNTGRL
jgi:hypothetical protein